jgi:hypothetical protein
MLQFNASNLDLTEASGIHFSSAKLHFHGTDCAGNAMFSQDRLCFHVMHCIFMGQTDQLRFHRTVQILHFHQTHCVFTNKLFKYIFMGQTGLSLDTISFKGQNVHVHFHRTNYVFTRLHFVCTRQIVQLHFKGRRCTFTGVNGVP